MDYIITEYNNLSIANRNVWGNKAACLADARNKGLPVPDGFCILFRGQYADADNYELKKSVEKYFKELQKRTGSQYYIVRSSGQHEDEAKHLFPGIYRSQKNVSDLNGMMEAIKFCSDSLNTEIAEIYIGDMALKEKALKGFCVLIQEQMEPDYSGVVFTKVPIPEYYGQDTYLVEMVKGHCRNMIQGKESSNSYLMMKEYGSFRIRSLSCHENIYSEIEEEVLKKLGMLIQDIIREYGETLDIEWGYSAERITIYQIRSADVKEKTPDFSEIKITDIGMKANAMKKFYSLGLFQKKLLVAEAGTTINEIMRLLQETGMKRQITVRYSCGCELGLPRGFVLGEEGVYSFLKQTWNPDWTVILHESIAVKDSYELYMDEEKIILEHIPGMWESDNQTTPDVWLYQDNKVTVFAAGSVRVARYEDLISEEYLYIEPCSEEELKKTAQMVFEYIKILKKNWAVTNGINFHFVRDQEDKCYFLNYREMMKFPDWESAENLTVIHSKEDLFRWKGGNILLKIDLKRGEEVLLKEYVPFLKKTRTKVYVQFGVLSHPAILLREMGIDVYPEYTLHKKYEFTML